MTLDFQGGGAMNDSNGILIEQHRSKQLERASFFKRLAIGAADPGFSAKLKPLVDEYEREAARAMSEMVEPTQQLATAHRIMPGDRTG
jgi:hypothetical protein